MVKNKKNAPAKAPRPQKPIMPGTRPPDPPGTTYRCTCCGESYAAQRGNFPVSHSQLFAGWGGYYPVCRKCMEKYYSWLLSDVCDGNERDAMERIAQLFDWYFDDKLLALAANQLSTRGSYKQPYSLVTSYAQKMSMPHIKKKAVSYADTMLEQEEEEPAEETAAKTPEPIVEPEYPAPIQDIDPEIIRRFGSGFSPEDYLYLQAQYEEWTECYPCDVKAQEELFISICLAQLNIKQTQLSGGDLAKATKAFTELLATLNIAPRQQKTTLTDADTFGTLIERWEKEEPVPEPDPAWADVDGIKKNISTWFFGHLCKMFKIENDWAQLYEDEIAPYTAHPPQYQGDFDLTEGR